jgi:hypothetical protein
MAARNPIDQLPVVPANGFNPNDWIAQFDAAMEALAPVDSGISIPQHAEEFINVSQNVAA